jgi:hypothetical protein
MLFQYRDYITSYDRMSDAELDRIWKEVDLA